MSPPHRNLIFVVLDTARADAFEAYGGDRAPTPTFTRLAEAGFAAPHAFASSSWTLPSHVGMLYGDHHRALGLSKRHQTSSRVAGTVLEQHRERYLPQVLKRNGYWSFGASANPWLQRRSGFDAGFEEFHDLWRAGQWAQGVGRKAKLKRIARHAVLATGDAGLGAAEELTSRWIARARQESAPGFLFLNLVEFHSPYLPPRPYNDLCVLNRARAGYEMLTHLDMLAIWRANLSGTVPGRGMLERMRHLYYQTARYIDTWLDRLLQSLRAAGLLEHTLVIVTSDHGENLGEGGRLGHSFSVDHNLIKVPLFFSERPSARLDGPFSLVDLPAVIAEELDLSDSPWTRERDTCVLADLQGVGEPDDPRVVKFLSEGGLTSSVAAMTSDRIAATNGRYKLVRYLGQDMFVDTRADPTELDGRALGELPGDLRDIARPMVDAVDRLLAREPDEAGVVAAEPVEGDGDLDEAALAEQMRLLGYI